MKEDQAKQAKQHKRDIAAERQKHATVMVWCERLQNEKAVLEEQRQKDQGITQELKE